MKVSIYENNDLRLKGRVSRINEYSAGKAANVTVAVDNGKDKDGNKRPASYIQTKSFAPDVYNTLKEGMFVEIRGHIAPNSYGEGENKTYTQDIVADYIIFLESKAQVEQREAAKAALAEE